MHSKSLANGKKSDTSKSRDTQWSFPTIWLEPQPLFALHRSFYNQGKVGDLDPVLFFYRTLFPTSVYYTGTLRVYYLLYVLNNIDTFDVLIRLYNSPAFCIFPAFHFLYIHTLFQRTVRMGAFH